MASRGGRRRVGHEDGPVLLLQGLLLRLRLRLLGPAEPLGVLERERDVGDGEELLHVDDVRPVVPALVHGGEDVVVVAGDAAEVEDEEVDDGVGGGELAAEPGDEAVALVHEPGGLLLLVRMVLEVVVVEGRGRDHGGGGGGDGGGGGGHRLGFCWPQFIEGEGGAMRAGVGDLGFCGVFLLRLGWAGVPV